MQTNFQIIFNSTLNITQEDNVTTTVTFSNDCESELCRSESDFKFFYKIIGEAGDPVNRTFELNVVVDEDPLGKGRMGSSCGGAVVSDDGLNIPTF